MKKLYDLTGSFFRIPDYQRGYSWGDEQLIDFWEDVSWLEINKEHYTGLLTLQKINNANNIPKDSNFPVYHLVDGQQRLTTIFIAISVIVNIKRNQLINGVKVSRLVDDYIRIEHYENSYLLLDYDDKRKSDFFHELLNTDLGGLDSIKYTTVYERNLINAKKFFELKFREDPSVAEEFFQKIAYKLIFDVNSIENEFDVCAMFESINYRGKKLTKFEVLKNRLTYLGEFLVKSNASNADKIRVLVNKAWGTAYDCLGSSTEIEDEDEFLYWHTIMYFGVGKGKNALDKKLFKEIFAIDSIKNQVNCDEVSEKIISYVNSIDVSARLWAYQHRCGESFIKFNWANQEIEDWLLRITRMSLTPFRPVILASLNRIECRYESMESMVLLLKKVEQFTFLIYELCGFQVKESAEDIVALAQKIFNGELEFSKCIDLIDELMVGFDESGKKYIGIYNEEKIRTECTVRFQRKNGWKKWKGIIYFLDEWNQYLSNPSEIRSKKDFNILSIEHIVPEDPKIKEDWLESFPEVDSDLIKILINDLGNLTLLNIGANKALQDKKLSVKSSVYSQCADGTDIVLRAGKKCIWTEACINERGLVMLSFMMKRWNIPTFGSPADYSLGAELLFSGYTPQENEGVLKRKFKNN